MGLITAIAAGVGVVSSIAGGAIASSAQVGKQEMLEAKKIGLKQN